MAGLASHQPSHLLRSAASPTGAWSCPSIICWCWCLEDKPETLGALCTERQWVASELQVLDEEDEDKNAGGKRVSVLAIATLEGEDSNQPAESTALVASMPL